MDKYLRIKVLDKDINVSFICLMLFIYLSRGSWLIFGRLFNVTNVMVIAKLALFLSKFLYKKGNIIYLSLSFICIFWAMLAMLVNYSLNNSSHAKIKNKGVTQ